MVNKLSVSRAHIDEYNDIVSKLSAQDKMKLDDIFVDYIVITCYAEFEQLFNEIINNKIAKSSAFLRRYIDHAKKNKQQLHGHLNKENLKELIKKTFRKKMNFEQNPDWDLYVNFIKFRDSIAHQNEGYAANKGSLIFNVQNNYMNIIVILEKILDLINP